MIPSFFDWFRALPLGGQALVTVVIALLLSALIILPIAALIETRRSDAIRKAKRCRR